jgi:hypothetical protein
MYGILTYLRYEGVFSHASDEASELRDQRAATHALNQSKFFTALRSLHDHYSALSPEPFIGFAIRGVADGEVAVNGLGHCIYRAAESAEEVIKIWARDTEHYELGAHEVAPCRVSLLEGLVWT